MTLIPLFKNTVKRKSNKRFLLRKVPNISHITRIFFYRKKCYSSFLTIQVFTFLSLTKGRKQDLLTMQNDALRFVKNVNIVDKHSIVELNRVIRLLSLEQCSGKTSAYFYV